LTASSTVRFASFKLITTLTQTKSH